MKGYTGKLVGIPIAIEKHGDGSITIAKDVVTEIADDKNTPKWIKDLLV